jgi:hypothetical protein
MSVGGSLTSDEIGQARRRLAARDGVAASSAWSSPARVLSAETAEYFVTRVLPGMREGHEVLTRRAASRLAGVDLPALLRGVVCVDAGKGLLQLPGALLDSLRPAQQRRHALRATPASRLARSIVASWLTRRPIRRIRLVGHTDTSGPRAYNFRLGERRTRSAMKGLERALERLRPGLTRRIRFLLSSLGERRPVASNATLDGRARNRRVEVFLSTRV